MSGTLGPSAPCSVTPAVLTVLVQAHSPLSIPKPDLLLGDEAEGQNGSK